VLNPKKTDLFDFEFNDVQLADYFPHPAIKGEIAV
jgi:thymidylate synthase